MGEMQDLIYSTTMSAVELGERKEQERIVKIVESKQWVGETLEEDVANLVASIRAHADE